MAINKLIEAADSTSLPPELQQCLRRFHLWVATAGMADSDGAAVASVAKKLNAELKNLSAPSIRDVGHLQLISEEIAPAAGTDLFFDVGSAVYCNRGVFSLQKALWAAAESSLIEAM